MDQGALFSVHFYDFTTFVQNIRGLVFVDGVLNCKTVKVSSVNSLSAYMILKTLRI